MAVPIVSIFDSGQYERLISRGAQTLLDGGLVVLPTETVYGAAGLITRPEALKRLRNLRGDRSPGPTDRRIRLPGCPIRLRATPDPQALAGTGWTVVRRVGGTSQRDD